MIIGTPRSRSLTRAACVGSALLVGTLLTACSPTSTPAGPLVPKTSPTPTSSPTTDADLLADVDPCALVPDATRADLALTDPHSKELAGVPVCRFRVEGQDLRSSYTVSVELFSDVGLSDIQSTDTERLPDIGSHQTARFSGPEQGCRVALAVTETSRVDVAAVGGDREPGCELAVALATAIEPAVP